MSIRLQEASHAAQLPDQLEQWIHALPAGRFVGRDGRGPYVLGDAHAVIAATLDYLKGLDLVIDYEHQTLKAAEHSGAVPAAGWVKEFEARENGIWARVEWTQAAASCLEAKEYRYFSPVYDYNPRTGEVVRLKLGALTNVPNLQLQAAASRQGDLMDDLMERLCYLLNLPLTTTAEEMKNHLDKLKAMLDGSEATAAASAELAKVLGLEPNSKLPDVLTAAMTAVTPILASASAIKAPDPAQWVPKAQYDTVAQSLANLRTQTQSAETARLVEAAMTAGKVPPALKDWATDYASRDAEGFKAYVSAAPVLTEASQSQGAPPESANQTLTPEEETVAHSLGLSVEAYLAAKKETDR